MTEEVELTQEQKDLLETTRKLNPDRAKILETTMKAQNKKAEESPTTLGDFAEKVKSAIHEEQKAKESEIEPGMTIREAVEEEYKDLDEKKLLEEALERINKDNFFMGANIELFHELPFSKRLELLEVTKDEAATICDSILTKGGATKKFEIRKVPVILVTRESQIYMKMLEKIGKESYSRLYLNELMVLYNAAGSLLKYGETEFKAYKDIADEDRDAYIQEKMNFLLELPLPVYTILSKEIVKFDLLIATVTSDEGLKNL